MVGPKVKEQIAVSFCVTGANHWQTDLLCHPGFVCWDETAQTFMVFLRVQTETEQKIEKEPRSLFRDERLQAVLLYLLLVSVRGASIMSYLVPARYFHPRCSWVSPCLSI